jgi:Tol biopolymer transport system component
MSSLDGRTVYFKSYIDGIASFWAISLAGGRPRKILQFDRSRPSDRREWTTDGQFLYFTIDDRQSDIWLVDLRR